MAQVLTGFWTLHFAMCAPLFPFVPHMLIIFRFILLISLPRVFSSCTFTFDFFNHKSMVRAGWFCHVSFCFHTCVFESLTYLQSLIPCPLCFGVYGFQFVLLFHSCNLYGLTLPVWGVSLPTF